MALDAVLAAIPARLQIQLLLFGAFIAFLVQGTQRCFVLERQAIVVRRRVALETSHELLRILLTFAVRAALAVGASPVLLGARNNTLVRQEALLMVLAPAAGAHENLEVCS